MSYGSMRRMVQREAKSKLAEAVHNREIIRSVEVIEVEIKRAKVNA
jgi:hypothetical protein